MRQPTLSLAVGFLIIGAVAGLGAMQALSPSDLFCISKSKIVASPGEVFQAERVTRLCGIGVGKQTRRVDLRISKGGDDGFSFTMPLLIDARAENERPPSPSLGWVDGTNLDVKVRSTDTEGIFVRHEKDLTVTVRYSAPDVR